MKPEHVFPFWDKEVSGAARVLLTRGYSAYGIPARIPEKIIRYLEGGARGAVPEIMDKRSVFWKGREKYSSGNVRHREVLRFVKRWLKGKAVLEVGCDGGGFARLASKYAKMYVGTDISLPKSAQSRGKMKFIRQKSETEVPVMDSFADVALLIAMLHHVERPAQAKLLRNVKRKLAAGGKIVVFEDAFSERKKPLLKNSVPAAFGKLTTGQKMGCMALIDWVGNVLVLGRKTPMPSTFRTMEGWEKLFRALGFRVLVSRYLGFPRRFFHQVPYGLFVLEPA